MIPKDLFDEIRAFCIAKSDPKNVEKYSRYFKEGFDSYGVSFENTQAKVDELYSRSEINLALILQSAHLLVPTGKYEETSFAFALVNKYKKEFTHHTFASIESWFQIGINNWAHTDMICGELLSYFINKEIVRIDDFRSWRVAKNKFQRRAVPVSFIKPFKKGFELKPLLEFIDPLMMDTERVVHQGLGWFLRECWKKQPEPVEKFLHKWKNDAARLIFQYATEKMTKEYRLNFRKEKK
nr:DNA alkylation repair protein [uncultured Carboxylicivirga sp.]